MPSKSRTLVAEAIREGARSIIDIGGGASNLVDHLLDLRLERVAVLDKRTIDPGGAALMATFAMDGPERCSGLAVRHYDAEELSKQCGTGFELAHAERHLHITPQGVAQSFLYSTFHRTLKRVG